MIGIEGLGVSLGKIKKNLTQSKEEALISSDPDALEKAGFQYHYIAAEGQSANDLALDAIHDLRENLNKEWGTIDVLMHANCFPENSVISLDTNEKSGDVRNRMDYSGSKLQSDLDLKDAFVIGLGQQGCTCTLGGLRVAQALLKSDEHLNNILLHLLQILIRIFPLGMSPV